MLQFNVSFQERNMVFNVGFASTQVILNTDEEYYKGLYEVTPRTEGQTMATKGLLMSDDVTVRAIPYYEVSNTEGGETVWIGEMEDGN